MSLANGDYSPSFFFEQRDGSLRSAQTILPIVFELIRPSSVVDVGCGVGTWLAAAQQLGIKKCLGLDGPYVSAEMLQIDKENFRPADLNEELPAWGRFDLAICLEVAEHLPEQTAPTLVRSLTALAPAVLFSAAIPGQNGTGHINEQWQDYWVRLFEKFNYVAIDCVRPAIWHDPNVEYWYAQNALLMADAAYVKSTPALRAAHENTIGPFSLVHPRTWREVRAQLEQLRLRGVGAWLKEGPSVLGRTFNNRLGNPESSRTRPS